MINGISSPFSVATNGSLTAQDLKRLERQVAAEISRLNVAISLVALDHVDGTGPLTPLVAKTGARERRHPQLPLHLPPASVAARVILFLPEGAYNTATRACAQL